MVTEVYKIKWASLKNLTKAKKAQRERNVNIYQKENISCYQ
jgi:hypothetical protein